MNREEFVFTIGYQGGTAIVDSHALRRYKKYSTEQLLEEGLFKAAFCSALWDDNKAEQQLILDRYNEKSEQQYTSIEDLKRVFGVFEVTSGNLAVNIL